MTTSPHADLPDDTLIEHVRSAFQEEAARAAELEAAKESTRLLLKEGWDRIAGRSSRVSSLSWEDLEEVSELTRSALRRRVEPSPADQRRNAEATARRDRRAREQTPGPHDPASVSAAARILGRPLVTVWRHAKAGTLTTSDGELLEARVVDDRDGDKPRLLVFPPKAGWPAEGLNTEE